MNTKTYFGTYTPRGFFVCGRKAYPFNRFHAPLGQTKPCLPREEEVLGPILYAYGEADAPWKSPDSRAAYFDRLADIERSHDVDWTWTDSATDRVDDPPLTKELESVEERRPVRPPAAAFLSRQTVLFPRKGYVE